MWRTKVILRDLYFPLGALMPSLRSPLKSQRWDPWQIDATPPPLYSLIPFLALSLRMAQILPLHLEPGPQFLNPLPVRSPSIHELFFSLFNSLLSVLQLPLSLSATLIPGKCRSFPDEFPKKQSLWRSSAELCQKGKKKCVGIVKMGKSADH